MKKLSPRKAKYAKLRGKGLTQQEAARRAGYSSQRARHVTGSELERDPRVRKLMADEMDKDLSTDELVNRIAGQARGEIPTKVVTGTGARVEYETLAAEAQAARIKGLYKDTLSGPDGAPISLEITGLTVEELEARLREKLALAGTKVRNA